MNKSELVETVASDSGLTKAAAGKAVDSFMETITSALKNGDQVVLPGFGSFTTGNRAARKGINPQTGKTIDIPASKVAKFKAGKKLKEAVKEG